MMTLVRVLLLAFGALAASCSGPAPPASGTSSDSRASADSFVNRVWRVRASSSVSPGALYVFLADGTLVMTSPHARPAFGTWTYQDGGLTMVEESIAYKVEILELARDAFRIRSHNPGAPVEITFERADDVPLPAPSK